MNFEKDFTYHVYNRSNNIVFKTSDNYLFFLEKFRKYISPYSDIIAWVLQPNHFHFMLVPNEKATKYIEEKHLPNTQMLSKQFGILLSSYTKAFNKQNNRKGSLFAHNTKAKLLISRNSGSNMQNNYSVSCFRYIHNNPVNHIYVKNIYDWEFSSYKDFAGIRNGNLINRKLAEEMINYNKDYFYAWSKIELNDDDIQNIL
ncbi:MAG: transposase [Chlorobi bacterium]|nr:transposase [Chlorobiota bacterium]